MSSEVLLSKIRLTIVAELLVAEWVSFSELRHAIDDVTNGNLSTHLAKLLEEGFIEEHKQFVGKRPNTRYRLTEHGRTALIDHASWLNSIVASAKRSSVKKRVS